LAERGGRSRGGEERRTPHRGLDRTRRGGPRRPGGPSDRRAQPGDATHPGGPRPGGPRALPDRRGSAGRPMRRRASCGRPPFPAPWSLTRVRTYPLASRRSKVRLSDLGRPHRRGGSLTAFLAGLPRILAGETIRRLASDIERARRLGKPILWGLGAHVIKVGLSPVIIDLMERGFVTGLVLNGAGIVHDFELAVAGRTSEDVEAGLGKGAFGMRRETGKALNRAIKAGDRRGLGLGAAVGRHLTRRKPRHLEVSLLAAAHRLGLPATVHVAVGTDIVHMHP